MTDTPTVVPVDPGPLVMRSDLSKTDDGLGSFITAADETGSGYIAEMWEERPDWPGYAAWLVRASNEYREWQPIETAPKDGTRILAFSGGINIWWWRENPRVGRAWFTLTDEWDDYDLEANQPTHWVPLPKPPVGEGGA